MCVYLLLYQSLYDLTNPNSCNLISVLVLINALGHTLISVLALTNLLGRNFILVLGHTNPLSCRLISTLVLTSHLKCQAMLFILLCLTTPFLTVPRLFYFSVIKYVHKLINRDFKLDVLMTKIRC